MAWGFQVLSALLSLRLSKSSYNKNIDNEANLPRSGMHWFVMGVRLICHCNPSPPGGGLSAGVISMVTAQIHKGCASRASSDKAGLANIAHTVTAYSSSSILARPYTPLSWLWRVCRPFSFRCILRESLSKGDQ